MQQAHVYIDGFYRFTPKELLIIESLLKTVDKVTIALSVDYENLNELDELDLFHQTTETYQNLKALAKEIEVVEEEPDRKITRLNSSHVSISYAVFCLKKKKKK